MSVQTARVEIGSTLKKPGCHFEVLLLCLVACPSLETSFTLPQWRSRSNPYSQIPAKSPGPIHLRIESETLVKNEQLKTRPLKFRLVFLQGLCTPSRFLNRLWNEDNIFYTPSHFTCTPTLITAQWCNFFSSVVLINVLIRNS